MDSAYQYGEPSESSVRSAWHHTKQIFTASSFREGWTSFTRAIDALPLWALVLLATLSAVVVFDSSMLLIPLAAGVGLVVIYVTVKRAVRDALREQRDL